MRDKLVSLTIPLFKKKSEGTLYLKYNVPSLFDFSFSDPVLETFTLIQTIVNVLIFSCLFLTHSLCDEWISMTLW